MSDHFVRLYETHAGEVYGYLAYRLGSRAAAETLTETTFERAVEHRAVFGHDRADALPQLLRIARDAAAERFPAPLDDGDLGIDPALAAALGQLGRGERSVLALRFGARAGGPEIARVLDLPERRVRTMLSRALRRLRTELDRAEGRVGARRSAPPGLADRDQDREHQEEREA